MNKKYTFLLTLAAFMFLSAGVIDVTNLFNYEDQAIPNYIPGNRDNTPRNNEITDEQATLGRVLFYDKNLSANNTISCASCHQQDFAFGDPRVQSVGLNGELTGRHSMRLVNARFADEEQFFWDERANSLEDQTTQPIQDHIEMGFNGTDGAPDFQDLITKLSDVEYYQQLFTLAYGDNAITEDRMQRALAQFIRSIQSFDAKYDEGRALVNNNNANFPNFTAQENLGKRLFNNDIDENGANCQDCHRAPTFDIRQNSRNNGVISVAGDPNGVDLTNTRAPSLRDLVNPEGRPNGPFMHDGSLSTLMDVINHYDDIEDNPNLDNRLQNRNNGQNLNLTQNEKDALVAFLRTLTGSAIYTEEKWSNPFDENDNLTIINGMTCADNGGDADNDGICADNDCDDNDANIGAKQIAGTACDDGNPNTENDAIQADGCACAGTLIPIPCVDNGGDADNDGICADNDCDDNDATIGAKQIEGTVCDDGNPNTENDAILADGCACAGTLIPIPCVDNGGDADNDGICADNDCNDNDATIGAKQMEGTACDDGNPNTENDTIQTDGCACAGTPIACIDEGGDSDGDGICDDLDACPMDANNTCLDTGCNAPTEIEVSGNGGRRVSIDWEDIDGARAYMVQLRFKGSDNWIATGRVRNSRVRLFAPENEYEYHIKTICEDGESEYSSIFELAIPFIGGFTSMEATDRNGTEVDITIEEQIIERAVTIYPNPASDFITIQVQDNQRQSIEMTIFDSHGQIMEKQQLNSENTNHPIDPRIYNNGTYIIRLNDGLNQTYHKVLIIKN